MRRRFRFVRVLKWAGTLACLLILAAFVTSTCRFIRWDLSQRVSIYLVASELRVTWDTGDSPFYRNQTPGIHVFPIPLQLSSGSFYWETRPFPWFTVPLWLPFLIALAATLLLWRLDRRVPPGHCRKCRYDLTGNTTGRCPECGMPFATSRSRL